MYDLDLINMLRTEEVTLMSARPVRYARRTLDHIFEQTGYKPQYAYFNEHNQKHDICKERLLKKYILPTNKRCVAIETHGDVRRMYAHFGIPSLSPNEYKYCKYG